MPTISVITPIFNGATFIADAADCLVAQSLKDIEWILIDDGSGDESVAVARRVAATLPFETVLVEFGQNRGAAHARNAGLARASGRYIKFLDIDDFIEPNHLRVQLDCLRAHDADFVTSPTQFHLEAAGAPVIFLDHSFDLEPSGLDGLARFIAAPSYTHCGCLFEKSILTDIGGYDETLVTDEDGWLIHSLLLAGKRPVPTTETHYTYLVAFRAVGVNLSSNNNVLKIQSRVIVCRRLETAARQRGGTDLLQAVATRMATVALEIGHTDATSGRELFADARRLSKVFPGMPYPNVMRLGLTTNYHVGLAAFQLFKHLRRFKYRLSGLRSRLSSPASATAK